MRILRASAESPCIAPRSIDRVFVHLEGTCKHFALPPLLKHEHLVSIWHEPVNATSQEFKCSLAIMYKTTVYSRLERVPTTDLFVVERGVVAKRGCLGLAGACFGRDVILSNENLRDLGDAIALTFVQTISLTQKDIFHLLPDYPCAHVVRSPARCYVSLCAICEPARPRRDSPLRVFGRRAYVVVRKAALRMALIRALVKAAAILKRSKYTGADRSAGARTANQKGCPACEAGVTAVACSPFSMRAVLLPFDCSRQLPSP